MIGFLSFVVGMFVGAVGGSFFYHVFFFVPMRKIATDSIDLNDRIIKECESMVDGLIDTVKKLHSADEPLKSPIQIKK